MGVNGIFVKKIFSKIVGWNIEPPGAQLKDYIFLQLQFFTNFTIHLQFFLIDFFVFKIILCID
jgi:hypothetical protein